MTRSLGKWCAAALLALVGVGSVAQAQVLYGSLTGNVTDPSGAAIPGAKVEALNTGTGTARQAESDVGGAYSFSNLQSGVYKITVTSAGFQTTIVDGITVNTNQIRRVDLSLRIAAAAETIEVNAPATAVLQTDRADVNSQISATEIANLPATSSAGRNYQALYKLVPGFSLVGEGDSSDGGSPQRAMSGYVNGTSRQNNLTRIDGTSNTYMWLPTNTAYVPPAESIESVSVVTNSFDAEQGNSVGAVVNVVTKSGTNAFHGSGFEYHTDNDLRAIERFKPVNYVNPKYILNQYGGSVGGPIRKNKLFFFADWEATKRRMLASAQKTVINPASFLDSAGNANFANATGAGGAGTIYDPATGNADGTGRQPFANNMIPASRIDPAAKTILGRINTAGFLNGNNVLATNNYLAQGSAQMNRNTVDSKVNYVINNSTTMFGRYSISPTTYVDPPVLGLAMGGATGGGQVGTAPSRIQNVGLGGTHVISPTMLVDINAGFTRQRLGAQYDPDLGLGNYGLTGLHIPGTNGDTYLTQGTPGFFFPANTFNGIGNVDTGNPFLFRDNQYVMNANMSWMKGRHNVRFGIEHTINGINHFQPQGGAFQTPRGSFRFYGNVTALNGGAAANQVNDVAQFLLGLPNEVGKAVQNVNPNSIRWKTWSWYIRDSWQVISALTVNLGLRWEYYPMATSDHSGVRLYNPAINTVLIGGYGGVPMDDGVNVGHGSFLPRFGLAYRLDRKTVVRAGFGMSADSNNWRFFRNNYPATTNSDVNPQLSFAPVASLTGETLGTYPGLPAGIPIVTVPDFTVGKIPLPTNVSPGSVVPLDFRRGYIYSYNLTLQREIGKLAVEAGYVGNHGVRLLTNENINSAPPGGGNTGRALYPITGNTVDNNCLCPDAPSWYNALQTKATWRLGGNNAIGAIYTFSRAINWEDSEEEASVFGGQGGSLPWPYPAYRNRNKALATYDRTHNLSLYGIYDLPFGAKQKWARTGLVSKVAGGWQLNWLLSKVSGTPFSLYYTGSLNASGEQQSADQVGPLQILGNVGPVTGAPSCGATDLSCHYFNPAAFAVVPTSQIRFGSTGRNIIRGPGLFNLDASIFRNFKITERVTFQIRGEMYGVTNTPHLNIPGTDPTNATTFGVITQTLNSAGRGTGTGGERWTFVSGKVTF